MRVSTFFLLVCLVPFTCRAWYIPCFCGCGLPIEYLTSVQHINQYPLQIEKTAQVAEVLRSGLSQLQALIKTYKNLKDTYDTIGKVQNMAKNFDFSRIASTWEIEDWDDLRDMAKRLGYSTKKWDKDSDGTKGKQTETSFLASVLKDARSITGDAKTDLESLERTLREVNGLNTDSAIRAIMAQETRNAQLKARAAAASQQVKSTKDVSDASGGGLNNDSASIADRAESSVLSKAIEASMWSDMANSINRSTLMRMQAVDGYVEGKRNAIIKEGSDRIFE